MANIITRSTGSNPKGAPLTAGELDSNFINLNADKVESTRAINTTAGDLTGGGDLSGDRTLGLASTGISAGTVQNSATQVTPLTLDIKGRVTAVGTPVTIAPDFSNVANKPTTLSGYGITDAQATITGAATTIDTEDLTASKVLVSNASGKVAASDISTTTLGYLDATSSVQGQLDSKQATTAKNAANGYAGLDANAKLPTSLLPALAISEYLGSVANQAARLALTGEKGDWCSQADNGKVYVITGDDPTSDASWTALTYPVTPGITLNGTSIAPGDTATITAATTNTLTIGTGLSGTSFNGSAAATIAIDSTVVTLTGTQTLTNKTLTSPTINGGTGAFTTLSSTGNTTLGDASADTLTINGTAVSIPNNLNFDSNTLFIDAANNLVGIGTSSSSGKLTVSGVSSSNVASFLSSASGTFSAISIGRTANEFSLGTVAAGNQFFSGTAAGDSAIAYGAGKLFVGGGNTGSSGTFSTVFDASGNVGIGTSTPSTWGKLTVYGGSSATSPNLAIVANAFNSGQGCSLDFVRDGFTQPINARILTVDNGASASTLRFQTKADGTAGALATHMTLTSSGNVGIGTTSPGAKLDVTSSTNTPMRITTTSGTDCYMQLANTVGGAYIGSIGNGLGFYTSGAATLRATLDSSGNLGLGVTPSAATAKTIQVSTNGVFSAQGTVLNVASNATSNSGWKYINSAKATLYQQDTGTNAWYISSDASPVAGNPIAFSQAMTLDASGRLLIGATTNALGTRLSVGNGSTAVWALGPQTTTNDTFYVVRQTDNVGVYLGWGSNAWAANSDERVKTALTPITDAARKVSTLRAVTGRYKTDESIISRAFLIAQDVKEVLPQAVDSTNPEKLGVRYTDTIPLLVAAIKELTFRLEILEAKVN